MGEGIVAAQRYQAIANHWQPTGGLHQTLDSGKRLFGQISGHTEQIAEVDCQLKRLHGSAEQADIDATLEGAAVGCVDVNVEVRVPNVDNPSETHGRYACGSIEASPDGQLDSLEDTLAIRPPRQEG